MTKREYGIFGTPIVDRDQEREWIKCIADRQAEKLNCHDAPLANPFRPGFERRSKRSWFEIAGRLAVIQADYQTASEVWSRPHAIQALLLILPIIGKRDEKGKFDRGAAFSLLSLASKKGSMLDLPLLSLRKRTRTEFFSSIQKSETKRYREYKYEVVGREVLKKYRAFGGHGKTTIDSAIADVTQLQTIEGIAVGKIDNIKAHYKKFRALAFERGYADTRAVWSEINQEDWPDDQVWLKDFPPLKGMG